MRKKPREPKPRALEPQGSAPLLDFSEAAQCIQDCALQGEDLTYYLNQYAWELFSRAMCDGRLHVLSLDAQEDRERLCHYLFDRGLYLHPERDKKP